MGLSWAAHFHSAAKGSCSDPRTGHCEMNLRTAPNPGHISNLKINLLSLLCCVDVQPVDPLELWDTPPFEPSVDRKKDMLFHGRGVSDDKGGLLQPIHVRCWLAAPPPYALTLRMHLTGGSETGVSAG